VCVIFDLDAFCIAAPSIIANFTIFIIHAMTTMTTRLLPSQRGSPAPTPLVAAAPRSNNNNNASEASSKRRGGPLNKKRNGTTITSTTEGGAAAIVGGYGGAASGGSMLWTCSIFGLVATVVNLVYIAKIVLDRHDDSFLLYGAAPDAVASPSSFSSPLTSSSSVARKTNAQNDNKNNNNNNGYDDDGDKGPILNLLHEAGFQDIDEETMARLPSWSQVTSLYGAEPKFFGLDSCQTFQQSGDAAEHFIGVAGTFNTGTNLLSELLISNCHMPERQKKYGLSSRGVRWQVQWGKHTPVFNETFRRTHQTYKDNNENDPPTINNKAKKKKHILTPETLTAENMFPAVTVRDPYKWMQSMCRHAYAAKWNHAAEHCPSLVPNAVDIATFPHLQRHATIPVHVKYAEFTTTHDSLVGFWNDWYQDYYKKAVPHRIFPFLLVRFEDVVYHPKNVTQTICECAGGRMDENHKFVYIVDSAKRGDAAHGDIKQRTSYLDALIKYGTRQGRYKGYEDADLQYVREHLDPNLMQLFGYPFHDDDGSATNTDANNVNAAAVAAAAAARQ
jgi:hypothetical protein